jgi:TolB protein
VLLVLLVVLAVCAAPAGATYPGTNGLIVFQRSLHPNPPADLYVTAPDGSGAHKVFATPKDESDAGFSPTGPQLAFTRASRTTQPQIYVGDLNTGQTRKLTSLHDGAVAPSFSPDGSRIAFFGATRPGPKDAPPPLQIFVINADGTGQRQLTHDRFFTFDPDWSPDGTKIVFMESRQVGKDTFQNRLAVINADGTGRKALTSFSGPGEINAKWFPDGKRIVFERQKAKDSDIMVMNADGTGVKPLLATRAWETNPIPSPDGTKIVFTSDRDRRGPERLGSGFEVYTMNADGTGITRLTNNHRPDIFPDWQRLP